MTRNESFGGAGIGSLCVASGCWLWNAAWSWSSASADERVADEGSGVSVVTS